MIVAPTEEVKVEEVNPHVVDKDLFKEIGSLFNSLHTFESVLSPEGKLSLPFINIFIPPVLNFNIIISSLDLIFNLSSERSLVKSSNSNDIDEFVASSKVMTMFLLFRIFYSFSTSSFLINLKVKFDLGQKITQLKSLEEVVKQHIWRAFNNQVDSSTRKNGVIAQTTTRFPFSYSYFYFFFFFFFFFFLFLFLFLFF